MYSDDARILSRPIKVHWAGWESNTLRMQQAGWKIAIRHDYYNGRYDFVFSHEQAKMSGMVSGMQIRQILTDIQNGGQYAESIFIDIQHMANNLEVYRVNAHGDFFADFQMIDATPRMVTGRIDSLRDSSVFAYAVHQAEEVVIDQADMTVVDHLKAIKELQSEEQKRLREKARRQREANEQPVQGNVVVQLTEYRR